MPELPEVETVRRDLEPLLRGKRLGAPETSGLALRLGQPVDRALLAAVTAGQPVVQVRRRAKYLLVDFPVGTVLVHLGMSGQLFVAERASPRPKHTHVCWPVLDTAAELRFVDPRRFGQVRAWHSPTPTVADASQPELADLGLEPLAGLQGPALAALAHGVRAPVKAFLLDQRRIVGLGNIYVAEALWEARVHPGVPAGKLSARAWAALARSIPRVLERGLTNRGTTLRDFVGGHATAGENQHALRVYGREGERCRRGCGVVRRRVDGGRSTYYCPGCQKR